MNIIKALGMFTAVIVLAGVAWSFGAEVKQAVFNAKQLGIEDLILDFGIGDDEEDAPDTNATIDGDDDDAIADDDEDVVVADDDDDVIADDDDDEVAADDDDDEVAADDNDVFVFAEVDDDDVIADDDDDVVADDDVFVFADGDDDDDDVVADDGVFVFAEADDDDVELSDDTGIDGILFGFMTEEPEEDDNDIEVSSVVAEVPAPVAVAAVATATVAAAAPTAFDIEVSNIAEITRTIRILQEQHGKDCIVQGDELRKLTNWDRAIDKYNEALRFIPEREDTLVIRAKALESMADAQFRKARELFDAGNKEEAAKYCRQAMGNGSTKAFGLLREIEDDQPKKEPVVIPTKFLDSKEYRDSIVKIRESMKTAKQYYAAGQYSAAQSIVETVLRTYPETQEAVDLLRKIEIERHRFAENEATSQREKMLREVSEAKTPRNLYAVNAQGDKIMIIGGRNDQNKGINESLEAQITKKMKSIVIPEINFREANIVDVIAALGDYSREHDDRNIPDEKRGVNFVLHLGSQAGGGGAAAPVSNSVWDPTPARGGGAAANNVPLISIESRFTTLLEALDVITTMAGLQYIIRGNIVMIMPENVDIDLMVHRMYNVLPTFIERVDQIPGGGGGNRNANNDLWNTAVSTDARDLKDSLGKLGVRWPEGSSVSYMSSLSKLVVYNTARNLTRLEEILAVLNVLPSQIQIEVRFVEVMQTDLDSFGFQWGLLDDWEMAEMKGDAFLPPASRRRVSMQGGSFTRGFDYLNQNENTAIRSGKGVADNLMTISSILTNPELSLTLHMLQSKKGTDLLSAPKVVALSGETATIRVVTEFIYPTEYNVQMLETQNNSGSATTTTYSGAVVEPRSFTMREVGVILNVTPEVTSDGQMIILQLNPQVVSEPTWKNYGSTYPSPTGDVTLPMEQPFFPVREINTKVQIYNGSTVVMGGMITEERITNEDKIPFFGDIPLVGFLFRNKYEQSIKRNLLLFVTAQLVSPDGRNIKPEADNAGDLLFKGEM